MRRQERKGSARGGSSMRVRGSTNFQNNNEKDKDKPYSSNIRGGYRGGRSGGRGNGVFIGRCFTYNEVGHQSYRCPKWLEDKGKDRRATLT